MYVYQNPEQVLRPHPPPFSQDRKSGALPSRVVLLVQGFQPFLRDVGVDLGGADVGVAEEFLHGAQVGAVALRAPDSVDCTDYECAQTPTQVRLVRVVTPNGRIHAVITSLLDAAAYPAGDFAALYPSRWRIDEAFKRLKYRLALENASGLSWLAAQQDFGAKVLADNLHDLAVLAASDSVDPDAGYKTNRTYAFAHLKRCFSRWLLRALPETHHLLAVLGESAINLIRFVPGASKPRLNHPKPHRKHAYKSTC